MHPLLKGLYRDILTGTQGETLWDSQWRPNLVVQDSNLLLASLMKRQEGISGILFWAVGEGDSSWDGAVPSPQPSNTRLTGEIARQAVNIEQITFLDEGGQPVETPTNRLEITAQFSGDSLVEIGFQPLREFALFGGNADESANSGFMIDQVIHPRIDMTPGMTLNRRLRLTFGFDEPAVVEDGELSGPGSSLPVMSIDGIGQVYSQELGSLNVTTIGELANLVPVDGVLDIPLVKLREFRAKCRMAMSLRIDFFPVQLISGNNVSDLLRQSPQELASQINTPGVTQETVMRLQSELDKLQVALDDSQLQTITIGELISQDS
jgi:hypothetical protein